VLAVAYGMGPDSLALRIGWLPPGAVGRVGFDVSVGVGGATITMP
jgi:hypothetical protein